MCFPVPAEGAQVVEITYEHLLTASGDRVDYKLPRSGSVVYDTPWQIHVDIKSKRLINAVYSPSHPLTTGPVNRKNVSTKVSETATRNPGAFQLSYLLNGGDATATLFTHADANGNGGYFLLLAGLGDAARRVDAEQVKRQITLVIDRSGSMQGEKNRPSSRGSAPSHRRHATWRGF